MLMPSALYASVDKYLHGLFGLANDPAAEVCAAFVQLIEVRPSVLEPHMKNVIEYMLQVNKDTDDEATLEACEFWSAYCDAQLPPEILREYFTTAIYMIFSFHLKPRFHTARFHGSEDAKDDVKNESLNKLNELEEMRERLEARKVVMANMSTRCKVAIEDAKKQEEMLSY
ncbi:hypothetical protein GOBAR_DD14047 [Gossypium barbadense]|nr:hypothetical protein GOBAR_DD14047 [Gossypium barbadense]